jgi:pyridoxal phosphate enzyme (YggS family)
MTTARDAQLAESLDAVRERLNAAAASAGRNPLDIELLAVTKFFPATDVIALRRLGLTAFGESREREAATKAAEVAVTLPDAPIRWHMIGRIQRNKARAVADWAYAAHSVDGAALVATLGRAAAAALAESRRREPLHVYVQVSLDGDPHRGGVDIDRPDLVDEVCALVHSTDGLDFAGLMAMPPLDSDPDGAFARLEAERDRVQAGYGHRLGLSAGMSSDLETAVKHGSTCVRVGTALMGERPLPSP